MVKSDKPWQSLGHCLLMVWSIISTVRMSKAAGPHVQPQSQIYHSGTWAGPGWPKAYQTELSWQLGWIQAQSQLWAYT